MQFYTAFWIVEIPHPCFVCARAPPPLPKFNFTPPFGRLNLHSTAKYVVLYSLGRKSTVKYVVLYSLGRTSTVKYVVVYSLGRKSIVKYVAACPLASPWRAGLRGPIFPIRETFNL